MSRFRTLLPAAAVRRAVRCALGAAAPAPVVAVVWWVLAPGGRLVPPERIAQLETPGHADAVFAAFAGIAGFVVALVWVARRPEQPGPGSSAAVLGLELGSMAGALLAWGLGVGLDAVLPVGDAAALRLTALPAVFVWPLVTAAVIVVDTVRDLVGAWVAGRLNRRGDVGVS